MPFSRTADDLVDRFHLLCLPDEILRPRHRFGGDVPAAGVDRTRR